MVGDDLGAIKLAPMRMRRDELFLLGAKTILKAITAPRMSSRCLPCKRHFAICIRSVSFRPPVLVSRDVGTAAALKGSLAGSIVNRPDDADELSSKLLSLLEKANDALFRQEARRIGKEYSWERHFQRLDSVLRQARATPVTACVS